MPPVAGDGDWIPACAGMTVWGGAKVVFGEMKMCSGQARATTRVAPTTYRGNCGDLSIVMMLLAGDGDSIPAYA